MSLVTNSNFLKIDFLYFNNFNYKMNKKQQYQKWFIKTKTGKMVSKINDWKQSGLIMDNYEDYITIYYHWLASTNCEKCNKEYTEKNIKCMDHNHNTGEYRNILCFKCNLNIHDNLHKFNKSGIANIHWRDDRKKWVYKRTIDGKRIQKRFNIKEEAIAYKIEIESGGV